METKDLVQLRQLNLELLRQLWVGQDAVRRSVARAASEVGVHLGDLQKMRKGLLTLRPDLDLQRHPVQRAHCIADGKTEAQQGKGLAWDPAEAGTGMRTQAFVPSTCQLGGWLGDLASLF